MLKLGKALLPAPGSILCLCQSLNVVNELFHVLLTSFPFMVITGLVVFVKERHSSESLYVLSICFMDMVYSSAESHMIVEPLNQ